MADGVVCPKCGDPHSVPIKFTWWGGVFGPSLLNHVRCTRCHATYNQKTGRDNTKGIAIYCAVCGVIILAAVIVLLVTGYL